MASETEKGESEQKVEDPKYAVGGEEEAEEEKLAVEKDIVKVAMEEEEAADKKNNPEEDERVKEDEGDRSEDDDFGDVKDKEVGDGNKKENKKQTPKEKRAVPRMPTSERPSRERKTVERYTETVSAKSPAPKSVSVVQGRGIQLKDIPNVAFKLSKRKVDDTLHVLHTILFGKKAKAQMLKRNISMFSGFVWDENEEEKQRTRLKEKLDKYVKEKLLDFADILNVPVSKSVVKKEELSAKLVDFLEAPHVTTDSLLAGKEKSKKRKVKSSVSKSPGSSDALSKMSRKRKENDSPAGVNRKKPLNSEIEEADDKSEHSESEDESVMDTDNDVAVAQMGSNEEQNNDRGKEEDEEEEEPSEQVQSSKNAKKKVNKDSGDKSQEKSKPVRKEIPEKSSKSKMPASEVGSASKVTSANHRKSDKEKKKEASNSKQENAAIKKQTCDPASKAYGKDQGTAKSSKPAKVEPTTAELHAVLAQILKEVDFNSATLSDILIKVGMHFGDDLSHRKSEVKGIIIEVLNNMSDDEEDDDDDDDVLK